MKSLGERLSRRIATGGPITVAEYMAAALTDPEQGYYRMAAAIGAGGDFTTAPEISQIFGELIGAWLIDCWDKMGRPGQVQLIELGPGRGTLMQDALRIAAARADWRNAFALHLVEINPRLRKSQSLRLDAFAPRWHETLATIPDGPTLLIANEFFDALPVRQLIFIGGQWRERLIGWTEAMGFHFVAAAGRSPLAVLLPQDLRAQREGETVEISPASLGVAAEIGRRVRRDGGAALIIDYGRERTTTGTTLQAVRAHRGAHILTEPGAADLSGYVDFERLSQSALQTGAAICGPRPQGEFLRELGIETRAESLRAGATPEQRQAIDHAVERLTGETAMGNLFKVISIAAPGLIPAGFANRDRRSGQHVSDYA